MNIGQELKEYAKAFDINSQSDMEIIMRTMNDMHKTIKGYGEPKINAKGYLGMDMMGEEGIGVCRNMAAYTADKYNEINPLYNARIVTVYMEEGDLIPNNIEHNEIGRAHV